MGAIERRESADLKVQMQSHAQAVRAAGLDKNAWKSWNRSIERGQ